MNCIMILIIDKMYSCKCSYVLRTFLLFPVFFFAIKKGNEKAEAFCSVQNKGKTKTTANIIKHPIIHIN